MIEVLLFAQLQEEVGSSRVTFQSDQISVAELKRKFAERYNIEHLLEEAMVAINEEYAEDLTIISSGDTVAFIPPVSGG